MKVREWELQGEAKSRRPELCRREIEEAASFYGVSGKTWQFASLPKTVSFRVRGQLRSITAFADWLHLTYDLASAQGGHMDDPLTLVLIEAVR